MYRIKTGPFLSKDHLSNRVETKNEISLYVLLKE